MINQLFGRSKEPFWQQAYVNLVRWIIELHRMSPRPWVTLRDVYRGTLDPELIKRRIAEVEAGIDGPAAIRVRTAELSGRMGAATGWAWEPAGDGVVRAKDDPELREQLKASGIAFEVVRLGAADPERRERLAAVKRWHEQDWQALDQKLRSSIIEGLSVFLSVFDLPDVARVFCPSAPPAAPPPPDEAPAESAVESAVDGSKRCCVGPPRCSAIRTRLSRLVVRCRRRELQNAGTTLLPQPEALSGDRQDVTVVQKPVENRRGDHRVAEHLAPFAPTERFDVIRMLPRS